MTPDLDALILSLSAINTDTTSRAVEVIAELRAENNASVMELFLARNRADKAEADIETAIDLVAQASYAVQAELRARAEKAEADLAEYRAKMKAPCYNRFPPPVGGWLCFHCGERLTTSGGAEDHFGSHEGVTPGCVVKVGEERGLLMALRRAEERAEKAEAALLSERNDAERYRWLRECSAIRSDRLGYVGHDDRYACRDELDAIVDAGIASERALAKPAIEEQTK